MLQSFPCEIQIPGMADTTTEPIAIRYMNSTGSSFVDEPPWTTTLSLSFGETNAAKGARLAPGIRWQFRDREAATELELRYEDTIQSLIRSVANAAIHASEGDRSLARIARW